MLSVHSPPIGFIHILYPLLLLSDYELCRRAECANGVATFSPNAAINQLMSKPFVPTKSLRGMLGLVA
jgi:hypothetical protein